MDGGTWQLNEEKEEEWPAQHDADIFVSRLEEMMASDDDDLGDEEDERWQYWNRWAVYLRGHFHSPMPRYGKPSVLQWLIDSCCVRYHDIEEQLENHLIPADARQSAKDTVARLRLLSTVLLPMAANSGTFHGDYTGHTLALLNAMRDDGARTFSLSIPPVLTRYLPCRLCGNTRPIEEFALQLFACRQGEFDFSRYPFCCKSCTDAIRALIPADIVRPDELNRTSLEGDEQCALCGWAVGPWGCPYEGNSHKHSYICLQCRGCNPSNVTPYYKASHFEREFVPWINEALNNLKFKTKVEAKLFCEQHPELVPEFDEDAIGVCLYCGTCDGLQEGLTVGDCLADAQKLLADPNFPHDVAEALEEGIQLAQNAYCEWKDKIDASQPGNSPLTAQYITACHEAWVCKKESADLEYEDWKYESDPQAAYGRLPPAFMPRIGLHRSLLHKLVLIALADPALRRRKLGGSSHNRRSTCARICELM